MNYHKFIYQARRKNPFEYKGLKYIFELACTSVQLDYMCRFRFEPYHIHIVYESIEISGDTAQMHNPVKAFTSRQCTTVNLEIFAVSFLRNFTNATFRENKTLAQRGNHSVVGDF